VGRIRIFGIRRCLRQLPSLLLAGGVWSDDVTLVLSARVRQSCSVDLFGRWVLQGQGYSTKCPLPRTALENKLEA
jgi:hypothetical protein